MKHSHWKEVVLEENVLNDPVSLLILNQFGKLQIFCDWESPVAIQSSSHTFVLLLAGGILSLC